VTLAHVDVARIGSEREGQFGKAEVLDVHAVIVEPNPRR
jgi:hypothetical protein